MQDEVREKSVALTVKVSKTGVRLTADLLKWAIRQYMKQAKNPKTPHGKQSVKQYKYKKQTAWNSHLRPYLGIR